MYYDIQTFKKGEIKEALTQTVEKVRRNRAKKHSSKK